MATIKIKCDCSCLSYKWLPKYNQSSKYNEYITEYFQ